MIRVVLFNLAFYGLTTLLAALGFFATYLAPRRFLSGMLRFWGCAARALVSWILGSSIEIRGREHLPTATAPVIAAKHQSELDVLVMVSEHPAMATVALQDLQKLPFFRRILGSLGYIPVTPSGPPQNRTQQVVEVARQAHAAGRPFVIFPEGTLMALGSRERYRTGIWHIYRELGTPVTPVAVSLGVIWPRREWRKYAHCKAAIEYLPPIQPGLDKDAFMERLVGEIETATMRLIEEHASGAELVAARDRFARGVANEDKPWQAEEDARRNAESSRPLI